MPVEDQWVEVGVFLVNTRTGERRLNDRTGGQPTLDTPTARMTLPQPRQPSLLRIPEPVEQPRPAHGPTAEPPRMFNQATRYSGIYDQATGQPRDIPGGLPTNAPIEDDGLGPVDVSAPLGSWNPMMGPPDRGIRPPLGERLSADLASNAFGPFIGGAEMLGGWAEKAGLDALFPGAETPHGMREALRERAEALREQELLADPEGGFGRAVGLTANEIATSLPGPSMVLGPLAGQAGGLAARTAGLGRTGQILATTGAGAVEQSLENLADTVDRPWQERAAAVALGAGLGLAGGIGDIHRAGMAPDAAPPIGLRERFAQARQERQVAALTEAGWRFEEQPDGTVIMTKPEDMDPLPTIEIGEDGRPRATAYGKEVLRSPAGLPPDLDSWISRTMGEDPNRLSYREKLDYYGQMVAEERAERERFHAMPPEPPAAQPELTPERWEELKAMNAERAARPLSNENATVGVDGDRGWANPDRTRAVHRTWSDPHLDNAQPHELGGALPAEAAMPPSTVPREAPPSPLATGLWGRFQARRPTAVSAPFDQRLAAAAYDRGLVRTPEDLSGLLTEAPRFAPAEPGRVAADAAIRDALEELRARPIAPATVPEPPAAAVGHVIEQALPGTAPAPIGKPSEAGFIRLRSEPPPPDTPEGAAMEAFIGDPQEPPMTMQERFDAMRHGVERFYAEMVNLDAPVERLGKRKGAPADMRRTIELQIQKTRGAADIAKNMAESRNDVESLWSIWNGADEATYRDWRRIGAAEREMELIDRANAGDEIEIDQAAADVARNYLDTVAPQLRAQNPRLDRLLNETRRWGRDNIIEPFVEAGILSREAADEIYAKNQAHLPFNRVQRAVEAMAANTQDEVARTKIHRITAGLSEVDKIREPMETLLQRAHHARVIAEQQKARNILADFVEQAPDIFPELRRVETKAVPVAMVEDKTIFRRKPTKTKKTEAFPVWRNGEMELWEGPVDVMNVVNFLGPHELQGAVKVIHRMLSVPGQMMRAGVTSTLEFALYRNPLFDQYEAFTNSKAGYMIGLDFLRGLWHVANKTPDWDAAMRAGAGNSTLVAMDRPETVSRIANVMQEQGLGGSIRAALDSWKNDVFPTSGKVLGVPSELLTKSGKRLKRGFAPTRIALTPLQAVSQSLEAPTRMGGYLAAEKPMPWNKAIRKIDNALLPESQRVGMGPLGPEAGMEEYRSNTLDFLRGGRTGKLINGVEAFFNAEVQGWDKMVRNLKHRPGPTLLKAFALYTIPALVNWELNHDNEEYRREPEWKKMMFYRLPLPNGTSVPIPRGRGLLGVAFGYVAEKVLDYMAETDINAARDVVAAFVQNTPTHYAFNVRRNGGVMPLTDVTPTALEPWVEIATNYDTFRDAPVEPRGQTGKLSEDRFSSTTSPTLRTLSDATPFSPIQVQHLVRGHLGGVGNYATEFTDQFMDSEFQELPPDNQLPEPFDWVPTEAPLIRGMVSREPVGFSSQPVQDFYLALEAATQARNSYNEAVESDRLERAIEIEQEHPEFEYAKELEAASEKLGKIRKEWNEIRALPEGAATPEEIRQWLHELDVEATLVAEDALRGIGAMK